MAALCPTEIAAWEHRRNATGEHISWLFTTEKARNKMARAYPDHPQTTQPKSQILCDAELARPEPIFGQPQTGSDRA